MEQSQPTPAMSEMSMEKVDADERILSVIHRHWFGLFVLYLEAVIGLAAGIFIINVALSGVMTGGSADLKTAQALSATILTVFAVLFVAAATHIYRQNKITITDKTVTQVLQHSLFGRRVSQLAMQDIEDVNFNNHGFFSVLLNYGVLNVQTAGEVENFVFPKCPNPGAYGKLILECRQKAVEGPRHNGP